MGFKDVVKKITAAYIRFIEKHYWKSLLGYLALTVFLGYHASQIEVRTSFLDLLPETKESVTSLKKVVDYYGGEGYLIGVVEWESLYKETLNWLDRLQEETGRLKNEVSENLKRGDGDWFSDWYENKDGKTRIETLISFYGDMEENLKNQLSQNVNEKYLNLLTREMGENILPDTRKRAEKIAGNPKNLDSVSDFFYALEDNLYAFKTYSDAIFKAKGGEKELIAAAEEISADLEKQTDLIKYVEFKFRTGFIKDHLLYFIDEPDLEEIKSRIQKKINYERRRKLLSSALLADEPVTLDFKDIEKKYEKSTKILKVSSGTDFFEKSEQTYEYYLNKDKDMLLLLIKPSRESMDLGFAERLVDRANELAGKILKKSPKELTIGFTGRYVKKIEDAKIIKKDLKFISILAVVLILLSVGIYFKKIRAVAVVGLPLVSGLVWSTGIVQLTIGYFNIITGFLIAILSGLGVDFGVNMFARYIEEKKRGNTVFDALRIVFQTTFLSNLTATATTAAAFFALLISDFKGFSQFGFTAGMGMLLILLGILFAFPPVLVIADKINPMKIKPTYKPVDRVKGKRLPFYRLILILCGIFTLFSIFSVFQTRFNADFYSLAAQNTMGKKLEKKAERLIKMSLWPVIIYAKDWETMKTLTQRINELKDQGKLATLDKVDSLYNYLPERQPEKKKIMMEIRDLLSDSVLSKLKNEDEKKKVNRLLEMTGAGFITDIEQIPSELRRQFLGNVPGYFIFYYPHFSLNMSKSSTIREMVEDVHLVAEKVEKDKTIVASDAEMFHDVLTLINQEGPIIVLLVVFAILFLLWLDFRSIRDVLVSLLPLLIGILWIFGWNYLMGWSFNYFNIVIFPVIMGLGIDYGVHLYHRYKEEGHHNILFVVKTTGMAIVIGSVTDMIGFGTLLLAYYKGLATMGQVALAGIFSCAFAGILFVSALLEFKKDVKWVGFKKALTGRVKEIEKIEEEKAGKTHEQ